MPETAKDNTASMSPQQAYQMQKALGVAYEKEKKHERRIKERNVEISDLCGQVTRLTDLIRRYRNVYHPMLCTCPLCEAAIKELEADGE